MLNVYAIGASRNIGYFCSLRLLAKGATITFLLRNTSILESDEAIRPYITSGHARLVKGDAMNASDVANGWRHAQFDGARPVDVLLSTVGGLPHFSLSKGVYMDPPNLVTTSVLNILSTFPADSQPTPPKIITVSSIGLTPAEHKKLPLLLKPLYGSLLAAPHEDKLGSERVALEAAGMQWPRSNPEPREGIMPAGWKNTLQKSGVVFPELTIIKPALLTDGACKGDKPKAGKAAYQVSEQVIGNGYTISRKDIAHFIAEVLLEDWAKYGGKTLNVAY
ncbi:hypothetical protein EIP91_003196 [Steccherinum ochraceum]|uniref:NAD(P)-binding domain-containing protein n=1 Tax=Steccherinum ochraceum TaxID=92696 RepID=A0A4R0RVU0_9APHY|nr:hypothetical protein EIP91_003196 [Steccherinum ochraceum]